MIGILQVSTPVDPDIISDTAVFINNAIAYITAVADSNGWQTVFLIVLDLFDGFG
jgi:hypothetical protein